MIKIGFMDYANVYPIFHQILNDDNIKFVKGVPSQLNIAMRNKEIDLSPASSIEFLRNYNEYKIIPDISVASIGDVKSVCIFSKYSATELDGRKIYFTPQSNTSTVLAKIILEKFYKIKPIYITDVNDNYDAKLLIGDDALYQFYQKNNKFIIDLGREWYNFTSLPFVFALWIINKDIENDIETKSLVEKLVKASKIEKNRTSDFLEKYIKAGYSVDNMLDYWNAIDYRLTNEHIKGLNLFYKYAHELNESNGNFITDIKPYLFV